MPARKAVSTDTLEKIAENIAGGSSILVETAERLEALAGYLREMASSLDACR